MRKGTDTPVLDQNRSNCNMTTLASTTPNAKVP